jgi:hypothetical protein
MIAEVTSFLGANLKREPRFLPAEVGKKTGKLLWVVMWLGCSDATMQGAAGQTIVEHVITELKAVGMRNYALFVGSAHMRYGRFTYSFNSFNRGAYSIGSETPGMTVMKALNDTMP